MWWKLYSGGDGQDKWLVINFRFICTERLTKPCSQHKGYISKFIQTKRMYQNSFAKDLYSRRAFPWFNCWKFWQNNFFLIFHKYSLAILDARLTRKVGSVLQCIFSQDRILGRVDVSLMSRTSNNQTNCITFYSDIWYKYWRNWFFPMLMVNLDVV